MPTFLTYSLSMHEPDCPSCMGEVVGYGKRNVCLWEYLYQYKYSLQWRGTQWLVSLRVDYLVSKTHLVLTQLAGFNAEPEPGVTHYVYGGR